MVIEGRGQVLNLAATYGREESYFVAGVQQGVPGCKFLIAGRNDGRAVFGQFGGALRIESKELLNRGSFVEVKRLLGLADDIFQEAEEKHLDAHGL